MEGGHSVGEAGDELRRGGRREHRGEDLAGEPLGREVGQVDGLPHAVLDGVRGEPAGPARVGRDQDQRAGDLRMAAVQLDREPAAERQPADVRSLEAERRDEPGEAVREVRQGERAGRIVRPAGAGPVPGHDRERVGEPVELRAPRRAGVADVAVQEDERRPRPPARRRCGGRRPRPRACGDHRAFPRATRAHSAREVLQGGPPAPGRAETISAEVRWRPVSLARRLSAEGAQSRSPRPPLSPAP